MNIPSGRHITLNKTDKWILAAALGSIWAAVEIIVGSFLHNIKFPLSGAILAIVAVYLLVSFAIHWKEPGIIIRAGIIAALMKSISPSAIIIGPMVGIFMEALFIELSVRLLGRNLAGFIVGGALGVTWALMQKIFSLLILYGFDLVRIAKAFYHFLAEKTGLENMKPVYLVVLIISLYALAGIIAAISAFAMMKRTSLNNNRNRRQTKLEKRQQPFEIIPAETNFGSYNILIVAALLLATLYLLNISHTFPAILSGTALIVYAAIRYKRSLRYLKKPTLWIQIFIITFLATMTWEWMKTGEAFSLKGLWAGLEINFRAILIIFSFSAISVELRNPLVKTLLYNNGLSKLYHALSMAFSMLPAIVEIIPKGNKMLSSWRGALPKILALADELRASLENDKQIRNNLLLITGKVQEGKTTFLENVISECKKENIKVGGFTAPGSVYQDKRTGFSIKDITTGNEYPLALSKQQEGWFKFRRFYFNPETFKAGAQIISDAIQSDNDLIVIDEIGPLELTEEGWHQVIQKLKKQEHIVQCWSVRESMAKILSEKNGIPEENIIYIGKWRPLDVVSKIKSLFL